MDGVARETLYHIIRKVDYMKEGEKGSATEGHEYIDVSIEPEMKPLLLQLQRNFTAYDLKNVVKLGVYPIRIYELLKQYETIGHRTLRIDQIKKMFELTSEYPRFSNFYQKIVKPAINDINNFTDLKILDVLKVKEDRNVVALQFFFTKKNTAETGLAHNIVSKKKQLGLFAEVKELNGNDLSDALNILDSNDPLFSKYQQEVVSQFGVTPSVFFNELKDKTEEDVQRAVRVTVTAQKSKSVNNVAGFFIEALRQNFTNEKEEKTKTKLQKKRSIEESNLILNDLKSEREQRINDTIRELTAENPNLTAEMIERIEQNPYLKIFLEGKKALIGRELELADYRQDYELRSLVKQGFIERFSNAFDLAAIDLKIEKMERAIRIIT
jgi:hypothetical protein